MENRFAFGFHPKPTLTSPQPTPSTPPHPHTFLSGLEKNTLCASSPLHCTAWVHEPLRWRSDVCAAWWDRERAQADGPTFTYSATYYKYTFDGETVLEIDKLAMVHKVLRNGALVDLQQNTRSNIGIS